LSFAKHDLRAMDDLLDRAVDLARRWTAGAAGGRHRVMPDVAGVDLQELLREPPPRRGSSPEAILGELETKIMPYLRDNGHPRFFGYVMSPPSAAGIVADLIVSAIDQNLTAWRSAPGATEMERLVVDWLRRIVGLPDGAEGLLTSGGSMATFTALAVARDARSPEVTKRAGLGRLGNRLMTLYVSDEVHMSVLRAAELLGLGTEAVRVVPSDAAGRLRPAGVARAVDADRRSGHIPFCVVASAGTVNTGAIDPIARLAAVARKRGLWLHVDAAYGGPLGLCREFAGLRDALGRADSVALDPHKWLYAPLDAGCVLFRDPSAAARTFATHGEYAAVLEPGERESYKFFDHGPELSRRFRALKVWMILKYHGLDRIARRIREEVELARELGERVETHAETELLAPVASSIVCFRYRPRRRGAAGLDMLNKAILVALHARGKVYLSNARVKGRFALRACLVNFRTTRRDIRAVLSEVVRLGRRLSGPGSPR